jgi:hypothetical protein
MTDNLRIAWFIAIEPERLQKMRQSTFMSGRSIPHGLDAPNTQKCNLDASHPRPSSRPNYGQQAVQISTVWSQQGPQGGSARLLAGSCILPRGCARCVLERG